MALYKHRKVCVYTPATRCWKPRLQVMSREQPRSPARVEGCWSSTIISMIKSPVALEFVSSLANFFAFWEVSPVARSPDGFLTAGFMLPSIWSICLFSKESSEDLFPEDSSCDRLTFYHFDISRLLKHGASLLGSAGAEFEMQDDKTGLCVFVFVFFFSFSKKLENDYTLPCASMVSG